MSILTQVALRKLANSASTSTSTAESAANPYPDMGVLAGYGLSRLLSRDPKFSEWMRNRQQFRQQIANYQPTKRGSLRETGQTLRNLPGTLANNVGNGLKSAANWVTSGYQNMKNR